jgi:hypothetical protein
MSRPSVGSGPHKKVRGVELGSRVGAGRGQSANLGFSSAINAIDGTPDNDDNDTTNDDPTDMIVDSENDSNATHGNSDATNVGILRALTSNVEQCLQRAGRHNPSLTQPTGTDDILYDVGDVPDDILRSGTDKMCRKMWVKQFQEAFLDDQEHL